MSETGQAALDRRLLAVCNIAAQAQFVGQFENRGEVYYDECGFLEVPQVVGAGEYNIHVALVGRVPEGVVVCYRGTLGFDDKSRPESQRILDWVNDLHAELVPAGGLPGLCHEGFVRAIDSLDSQIEALAGDGTRIYCGHSKGGACAALAALRHCRSAGRPARCVTFGGPRAGNAEFAKAFDESAVSMVRYENAGDLVPLVPLDLHVAEKLVAVFHVPLPAADYSPVGQVAYVDPRGIKLPVSPLSHARVEFEQLFDLSAKFGFGGFRAVRDSHSIEIGGGYATALELGFPK